MSNEKTISAGQVELIINPGRQSLEPLVLTFGCSENERDEEPLDFIEDMQRQDNKIIDKY